MYANIIVLTFTFEMSDTYSEDLESNALTAFRNLCNRELPYNVTVFKMKSISICPWIAFTFVFGISPLFE